MHQHSDSTSPVAAESQPPGPAAPAAVHPVTAQVRRTPTHQTRSRWPLFVLASLLAFAVATTLLVRRSSAKQEALLVTGAVAAGQPTSHTPVLTDSDPAPVWIGRRQPAWASDGSKTIEFQLEAINDVAVWMTRVRPTLVARCLSHSTDVFIVLKTAASVEARPDVHTVQVQIDEGPDEPQQWSGSQSQQELFAPDGREFIRRLARAQRLRFAFKPYNAKPVTADFFVRGFDRLAGLVAGTCGWRLEESADTAGARVSLNRP